MSVEALDDWVWSMPGSCDACGMMHCQCNLPTSSVESTNEVGTSINNVPSNDVIHSSTTFDAVFNTEEQKNSENVLDDVEIGHDEVVAQLSWTIPARYVRAYKKNSRSLSLYESIRQTGVDEIEAVRVRKQIQERVEEIMDEKLSKPAKTRYEKYSVVTVVRSGINQRSIPHRLSQHDKFINELKRWARSRPDDTDTVLSICLEKYAALVVDDRYKNKLNSWYMQACKNAYFDELKRRGRDKRSHEHTSISLDVEGHEIQVSTEDTYSFDAPVWTDRQQQGWQELERFLDTQWTPDGKDKIKVPESIKRKIRGIQPAVVKRTTQSHMKEPYDKESDQYDFPVSTSKVTGRYEQLKHGIVGNDCE